MRSRAVYAGPFCVPTADAKGEEGPGGRDTAVCDRRGLPVHFSLTLFEDGSMIREPSGTRAKSWPENGDVGWRGAP